MDKFNITPLGKPRSTPLSGSKLSKYEGVASSSAIAGYQQRVGSINFLAIMTRTDLLRAVSKLAEFQSNPGPAYKEEVQRCLQYMASTRYLAIEYDGNHKGRLFLVAGDAA